MRNDPIIICGCPRSGTSITAAILERCGLWLGNIMKNSHPDNPRGFFENTALRRVNKNLLKSGDYDERGVYPIPPVESYMATAEATEIFRQEVSSVLAAQKCPGNARWGFKDPKALLTRRTWLMAFPEARFVIARRDRDAIMASCKQATFFRGLDVDWPTWIEDQIARCVQAEANGALSVWPGFLKVPVGWHAFRTLVEELDLEWAPGAQTFFDEKLWNRNP